MAQSVKNLVVMQETWVWSLCQEDPLVKEMITHYGILAWRIPWTEKPGGLTSMGSQWVNTTGQLTLSLYFFPMSGFVSIWKKKNKTPILKHSPDNVMILGGFGRWWRSDEKLAPETWKGALTRTQPCRILLLKLQFPELWGINVYRYKPPSPR